VSRIIKNFSPVDVAHALTEHLLRKNVAKDGAFSTVTRMVVRKKRGELDHFRVEVNINPLKEAP